MGNTMLSTSVIIWIAVAILFGTLEAFTTALISIWLAVGSVFASIAAYFGIGVIGQLMIFSAVSLILLIATRPFAKKVLSGRVEATNADRIVGKTAQVTEEIDNIENCGQVKVSGEVWTARSVSDEKIAVGSKVKIERIEGVKVIVSLIPQDN